MWPFVFIQQSWCLSLRASCWPAELLATTGMGLLSIKQPWSPLGRGGIISTSPLSHPLLEADISFLSHMALCFHGSFCFFDSPWCILGHLCLLQPQAWVELAAGCTRLPPLEVMSAWVRTLMCGRAQWLSFAAWFSCLAKSQCSRIPLETKSLFAWS